ncbi:MAG: ribonuclease P protein component [Pseudomonadota bacterium]
MSVIRVIAKRRDFLLLSASGLKFVKPSVIVQARKRDESTILPSDIRIGFTATKRLGGAVIRNKAKRRMRHAVSELVEEFGVCGYDYVFIARELAYKGEFTVLLKDVRHALRWLRDRINEANSNL